jgi:hypothetical protein
VAERLRQAAADGRILAQELEDRLSTALRARTYGELDAVVADLPGSSVSYGARHPQSRARQLVLAQPLAMAAIVVAFGVVAFVLAAVVLAGLFALSSVWFVIALVMFARRGPHGRHGYQRRYAHHRHRF